ncbi:hypothetical protein OEA41_003375 [Lepraria neglecta]|uniref:Heterokaryon incompatibility domain-containing protein n=1 Tax=Lepraria neglecta TaxID=209136 RepID=A0AAD9Z5M2_9LECA|nr:hypothetical protein OEA41_003375 [Lepraria neglecta]
MAPSQVNGPAPDSEARIQQAHHRESLAAINFAPPVLGRLNETYTRPRQTYYASNLEPGVDDELCATCAALDLVSLFRDGIGNETTPDGIRIRKGIPMGCSDEIYGRARCPLCRLLVEIGDTNMSGGERDVEFWSIITIKGHEIISSIAEPLYEIVDRSDSIPEHLKPEAIYLALVRTVKAPPGYRFEYRTIFKDMIYVGLLGAEKLISSRRLALRNTGNAADTVQRIREWLERCSGHETCRIRKAAISSYPDGFRLFDITNLRVVDAKGQEPYIALSYPWAQMDKFNYVERGEPYVLDNLPKTLQDIIGIVRGLDLKTNHIWMDQLCVDQKDPEQKQNNISSMDAIYGAALATIILAVPSRGEPEQGLTGISVPRRPYQRVESVGNLKLATTLPSLEMAIVTSHWNSRAWTLQEGILSSRCILFGPEQVYFECAQMACSESIQEPDVAESDQDHLIPYKSRLQNPFLHAYDFEPLYWRLVRDYTGRDMTNGSDALNAFSAFAGQFERDGHRLTWGLPASGFAKHLLWEHEPWDFRDIHRRREFPSWSWAGWTGTAAMNLPLGATSKASYTCAVIEEPSHDCILKCNARTVRVGIAGQAPICSIVGASVSSFMMDCGITTGPGCLPEACTLMEICRADDMIHCLLLEQRGEIDERIGSGFAKASDLEAAGLQWQEVMLA